MLPSMTRRSRTMTLVALLIVVMLMQWCQNTMAVRWLDVESGTQTSMLGSSTQVLLSKTVGGEGEGAHGCCPDSEVGAQNSLDCDDYADTLSTDQRGVTLDSLDNSFSLTVLNFDLHFDDAMVLYWRHKETLWSGLSRPIYLLISLFLE